MGNDIVIDDVYTLTEGHCPECGEKRATFQIHVGIPAYVCGWSAWLAYKECEGTRYLKYIVSPVIPEPQEP